MSRVFAVERSCHGMPSIQAHDLSLGECLLLRRIVCNNYTPSEDYKAMTSVGAFLQGYQEPRPDPAGVLAHDGWALVEFWTNKQDAISAAVAHVNAEFAKAAGDGHLEELEHWYD